MRYGLGVRAIISARSAGCLWLAFLLSPAAYPGDSPAPPLSQPLAFSIEANDPILAGHGPSRRFTFTFESDGTLDVYALAPDLDPFLRIEDAGGALIAEDDDKGGGKVPFLERSVASGDVLVIVVALNGERAHGAVRLHLGVSHETDAMRAAAAQAESRLNAIQADASLALGARCDAIHAIVADLLAIRDRDESRAISRVLRTCAVTAQRLGDSTTARDAYAACLARCERNLPPDHLLIQSLRGDLGAAFEESGNLDESLRLKTLAFDAALRTLPDDHPSLQVTRAQQGVLLNRMGRHEEAIPILRAALSHLQKAPGPPSQNLTRCRVAIAVALRATGRLEDARALLETAVASYPDSVRRSDVDALGARSELGVVLRAAGEIEQSRRLLEGVLADSERVLGPESRRTFDARRKLAATLGDLGDFEGARILLERQLADMARVMPADHPNVLSDRGDLANQLEMLEDHEGARRILEGVIAALEAAPNLDPRQLQIAKVQLATTLAALGRLDEAERLQREVESAWSRRAGADDIQLQAVRLNLVVTLIQQRKLDEASKIARSVLAANERTLQPGNPQLARTRGALFAIARSRGDVADACVLAEQIAREMISSVMSAALALSPRETQQIVGTRIGEIGQMILTLSASVDDPARKQRLDELAWTMIETVHSATTAAARVARAAAGANSDDLRASRDAVAAARRVVSQAANGANEAAVVDAARKLETAEKQLRDRLSGHLRFEPPSARAVADALPADTAAVSFWRYRRGSKLIGEVEVDSMAAIVLRHDSTPVAVALGPFAPIDEAVSAWRRSVDVIEGRGKRIEAPATSGAPERDRVDAGALLRSLVFDPLRAALGDAKRIVLVPDDALELVPFDALPDDKSRDGVLGDRFEFEIRGALGQRLDERGDAPSTGGLVLAGDVDFGEPSGAAAFAALPGTADEVRAIRELRLRAAGAAAPVELLAQDGFTKDRLAESAPRARFLHLATHGLFEHPTDSSGNGARTDEIIRGLAPLTFCGLALAGANAPADDLGRRDGILTGEEIAALDLTNCELAVLSACDTKLGERGRGHGLASLEAALHAAGARTTITSLWRVPDAATRELMIEFYRRIWVEKQPKARALWDAKRAMRKKGASVADWAGWVLCGDPK